MTRKGLLLLGFALAAALHLGVPASMIWSKERVLSEGEVFKFRTAPVDPYDAFRGRFVALQLEPNTAALPAGAEASKGQRIYVRLSKNAEGFAAFEGASLDRPSTGPYWAVKARWGSGGTVTLDLPIDRFYMEESMAPRAEAAYREHSRRGAQDAYVTVRIRDGKGVLENLFVAGKPIDQFVREEEGGPK
jgi:uncharacterized membrane-anchored protein